MKCTGCHVKGKLLFASQVLISRVANGKNNLEATVPTTCLDSSYYVLCSSMLGVTTLPTFDSLPSKLIEYLITDEIVFSVCYDKDRKICVANGLFNQSVVILTYHICSAAKFLKSQFDIAMRRTSRDHSSPPLWYTNSMSCHVHPEGILDADILK